MAEDFVMNVFWMAFAIGAVIGGIVGITIYIFESIGTYTIAKRRGLKNPWLAWIPFANFFMFGSIADDCNQKLSGKKTNNKQLLLWLGVASKIIAVPFVIWLMDWYVNFLTDVIVYQGYGVESYLMNFFGTFFILYFLLLAVSIAYAVFYYIALHKVYKSYTQSYVLLLVFSIIFGITPFVLFAIRNKDVLTIDN